MPFLLIRASLPRLLRTPALPTARGPSAAFTLIELAVVAGLLAFFSLVLASALSRTQPQTKAVLCARNLRTLTSACQMYAHENSDRLLTPSSSLSGRPAWVAGTVEDIFATVRSGTLFPYTGKNEGVFRCPADASKMIVNGVSRPRPRSYSMSDVFGSGGWLDRIYNPSQTVWRTYARGSDIVLPARTFLFLDEHPDSINDGSFANACTGAQPGDPPTSAYVIDFPANYHNGGCNLSFADGHVETHVWEGALLRNAPITYTGVISLNVPAFTSARDIQWLASRTTVRR